MIYVIYAMVITIFIALFSIVYYLNLLMKNNLLIKKVPSFSPSIIDRPMIIEKAYNAIDLHAQFEYTPLDAVRYSRSFDYFSTERIVRNEDHLKYIMNEHAMIIGSQMLEEGLIEVIHDDLEYHPYRKVVRMRVKVYKEKK